MGVRNARIALRLGVRVFALLASSGIVACTSGLDFDGLAEAGALELSDAGVGDEFALSSEGSVSTKPDLSDAGSMSAPPQIGSSRDAGTKRDAGADAASTTLRLVTSVPGRGGTNVAPETDLSLTFNHPVEAGSGDILLLETLDDVTVDSVEVTGQRVSFDETTVDVTWEAELSHDTEYTIVIPAGAIVDSDGRPFVDWAEPGAFTFRTGLPTPVSLSSTTPEYGAVDVELDANIELEFNVDIVAGAVGSIALVEADTLEVLDEQRISDSPRITIDGAVLTYDPGVELAYEADYFVTLNEGAIRSAAGALFEGFDDDGALTFTTRAPPAPALVGTSPADDAIGVDPEANLVLQFDVPISVGTGLASVFQASDDQLVEALDVTGPRVSVTDVALTIDLTAALDNSTEYYVNISSGAVLSEFGTSYDGLDDASSFDFTTAAEPPTPLLLVSSTPMDDATDVNANANLVLVFSEAVVAGAGNITIFRAMDNTVFETIPATDDRVTIIGQTVTVDPTGVLADDTEYYVIVGAGTFESESGASYRGLLTADAFDFRTAASFSLTSTEPADDASDVSPPRSLVLEFSGPAELLGGDLVVSASGVVETIAVDGPQVTVDGSIVTVQLNAPLKYDTSYFVTLSADAVGEVGGDPFAGLSGTNAWNFSTVTACDANESLGPNGACFYVFATMGSEVNWDDARLACRSHDDGWDLAALRSANLQTFIEGLAAAEAPGEQLWIGASDAGTEGQWLWVTDDTQFWEGGIGGSVVGSQYANWKSDQPSGDSQNCARILPESDGWQWADAPCDETYGFICEGPTN